MKSMTDSSEPDTFKLRETLSNNTEHGKKAYLKEQRRLEVAHENEILLEKCRKITEADTTSFFRCVPSPEQYRAHLAVQRLRLLPVHCQQCYAHGITAMAAKHPVRHLLCACTIGCMQADWVPAQCHASNAAALNILLAYMPCSLKCLQALERKINLPVLTICAWHLL